MHLFHKNLNACVDSRLRQYIRTKKEYISTHGSPTLKIESAADGDPTASCRGRYLHSRRAPAKEAQRTAAHYLSAKPDADCIILLGFGLGYYARALYEQSAHCRLIFVIPDGIGFIQALETLDISPLLSSRRCVWFIEIEPAIFLDFLETQGYRAVQKISIPALVAANPPYFENISHVLQQYLRRRQINLHTLKRFGNIWIRNLCKNLAPLAQNPNIAMLQGCLDSFPVLIVGGGPSLDALLPSFSTLYEHCVIAAADTSLPILKRHGISPDVVVAVDPQYWNTRHLDDVMRQNISAHHAGGAQTKKMILISELTTYFRIFRILNIPTFFSASLFPLGQSIEQALGHTTHLNAGGTVVTTAWELAQLGKAHTIYLAGVDLGFPDGRTHAQGCWFEESMHMRSTRTDPAENRLFAYLHSTPRVSLTANDGTPLHSDVRMEFYRQWFETQRRLYPNMKAVNISPKSAHIAGIEYMPVQKLCTSLKNSPPCRAEIDSRIEKISDSFYEYTQNNKKSNIEIINEKINNIAQCLERAERLALDGKGLAEELMRTDAVPAKFAALEKIDNEIITSSCQNIIGFLLPAKIEHLTHYAHQAGQADHADKKDHSLKNSITLYGHIAESARWQRTMLLQSIL